MLGSRGYLRHLQCVRGGATQQWQQGSASDGARQRHKAPYSSSLATRPIVFAALIGLSSKNCCVWALRKAFVAIQAIPCVVTFAETLFKNPFSEECH
jgi:hypothetical protein